MSTFSSFYIKLDTKLSETPAVWYHNIKRTQCEVWNISFENQFKRNYKQSSCRTRLILSLYWDPNEWKVSKKGIWKENDSETKDSSNDDLNEITSDETISKITLDHKHLEAMSSNFEKNLSNKTVPVRRTKRFQFWGFFLPRRLRNQGRLDNTSQALWSPVIFKRRAFSPSVKYPSSNNVITMINSGSFHDWEKNTFKENIDVKFTKKITGSHLSKLKPRSMKAKIFRLNETINANENYLAKHKFSNNFSISSRLIFDSKLSELMDCEY